ncbi:MAG: hypothetical protein RLZZ602_668 [Pseudomonadota bacterium]|jgi:hydroxybutyrate-dimer hydrolase
MAKFSSVSCDCSSNKYRLLKEQSLVRYLRKTVLSVVTTVVFGGSWLGWPAAAETVQSSSRAARIISEHDFDGKTDDLLTAGLGLSGLAGPVVDLDDALQPSYHSLRRRAIQQNYRGLIDLRPQTGFGRTYGPIGDIRIAGKEILAALPDPSGRGYFSALLQIPSQFDKESACLVVVASSGSRGIFGALPTAAEWVLQQGCAVVHTDKGTGTGAYVLGNSLGIGFDGRVLRDTPQSPLAFRPDTGTENREQSPLIAFKHAHSGINPEQYWGDHVLQAGKWALSVLNRDRSGEILSASNTLIVAVGISNGGGAVLRAIEQDKDNFFDGVVAAEPNIANNSRNSFMLKVGITRARMMKPISLYEWSAWHALLQPCAVLAEDLSAIPLGVLLSYKAPELRQWCQTLFRAGLLSEQNPSPLNQADVASLAQAARRRLLDLGVEAGALKLGAINVQFDLWQAITATYSSALSGSLVDDHPCAIGFAATDATGVARMLEASELTLAFADSSGIAPTATMELVAREPSGRYTKQQARTFDTTTCLHDLLPSLQPAIQRMMMRGYEGSRPVLILHGRKDGLVSVTHTSRAYAAGSPGVGLRYYELRPVQHFDAFLPVLGMDFQPMQPAMNMALRHLFAYLQDGTPLPASQVTDGTLSASPGEATIIHGDGTITIPD